MKKVLPSKEIALISKAFDAFFQSETFEDVMANVERVYEYMGQGPAQFNDFYPYLKVSRCVSFRGSRIVTNFRDLSS